MLTDGDPNLTELLFYTIKIRFSIEDLATEIRNLQVELEEQNYLYSNKPSPAYIPDGR